MSAQIGLPRVGPGHNSGAGRHSVFAITFDMDTTVLEASYHDASWQNAYSDIARTLGAHGFTRQQGSMHFGNDNVDAVRCVLAVQDLSRTHVWFRNAVRDIRMLRIEDNNDLMPAVAGI